MASVVLGSVAVDSVIDLDTHVARSLSNVMI